MQNFIDTANKLGKSKKPFFFLIDFAKKTPHIIPLDELSRSDFSIAINDFKNQPLKFSFTKEKPDEMQYQKAFKTVIKEIIQGNSYLLNLTTRTKIYTDLTLEQIFNYANAKYKLLYKDKFVCFSPECFVKIIDNKIYSYPMKGTILDSPKAREQLLKHSKEQQEHNTIVDLIRNDLAMVGFNIEVTKLRFIDKIDASTGAILQTSSEIVGDLDTDWHDQIGTILDKLTPAGSISGAPKAKTLEIINRVEATERGFYTGIFGIFDGKNLDSAVAIRFIEKDEENLYFRSGGGITYQSNVKKEFQEVLNKVYVPIATI